MNMWAGLFIYLVVIGLSVLCMAISLAMKLVCSPGYLLDILYLCFRWVINSVACFFFHRLFSACFGGINDPFV